MTQDAGGPPPAGWAMQRSSRDPAAFADRIADHIAEVGLSGDGPAGRPQVSVEAGIDANGMSSETVVLTVTGTGGTRRMVARLAPSPRDVPVFPEYRLDHQAATLDLVRALSTVPVPRVRLVEPTGEVLGVPFFLMDHVEGRVPPDVLPYTFGDNWFHDADPADRRALQDRTVGLLADLHAIPGAATTFGFLGDGSLRTHLDRLRTFYEFGARDVGRSPLVERGLAVLERTRPDDGDPVLLWGDARPGNVLYDGFTPVAVLDWEMTTLGPRGLDVGWMLFGHMVFQCLAETFELPGLPGDFRREDVVATYTELSGHDLPDLDWHLLCSAVTWGCVFLRTGARQVHFGEIEMPSDPEALFHHKPLLEGMLE